MALLTIAIPTYRRETSLKKCIASIVHGLDANELKKIKLVISDNDPNSTVFKMLQDKSIPEELSVLYSQNLENIGADRNILRCIELTTDSEFFWLLGDDDYPQPGLVATLLENLTSNSPDCAYLECRGRLWTTMLPKKSFLLFSRTVFLAYVNFHTTFISAFVWRLESVKRCLTDPQRPIGTFLDQLGWVLPIIANSKKFLIYPHQAFTGGEESTGGYNFTEVFVTNFWHLWRQYNAQYKLKAHCLPTLYCRTLMLVGFYPQILMAQRSGSAKFSFSVESTSKAFRIEFWKNPIYWIFVEPCIELPIQFGKLVCKLLMPLRLLSTLFVIALVRVEQLGQRQRYFPSN